jgi:hypothetical protein
VNGFILDCLFLPRLAPGAATALTKLLLTFFGSAMRSMLLDTPFFRVPQQHLW